MSRDNIKEWVRFIKYPLEDIITKELLGIFIILILHIIFCCNSLCLKQTNK